MDGTDGTCDTRYFSAVYLLARIVIVVAYAVTLTTFYYALGLVLLIVLALIVIVVKPYRNIVYNRVDTVLILLLAMVYSSILIYNIASVKESRHVKATLSMSFIVAALPLVYLFFICVYWVLTRSLVQDRLCMEQELVTGSRPEVPQTRSLISPTGYSILRTVNQMWLYLVMS